MFVFNDTATTEIYTSCHTLALHDALPFCAIDREGILRVRIAVGIMGAIFEIAVDVARLEAELHMVREAMRDRPAALQRTAGVAVPADRKSTRLKSSH